jgi:hypothetical protein
MDLEPLIAALSTARLLTLENVARAREIAAREGALLADRDGAALLLNFLREPIPGHISHDFAFWNETREVVSEFAAGIPDLPLGLELLEMDGPEERMKVRATARGERRERWIEVDGSVGGLDAFAAWLNQMLGELEADVRVYALETNEFDWHVFVIRTKEEVEGLRALGQIRPLRNE